MTRNLGHVNIQGFLESFMEHYFNYYEPYSLFSGR